MFGGGGRSIPSDIWALLGVLLLTLALQSFDSVNFVASEMKLTAGVLVGKIWQLLTYMFVATGGPGFWFLISMFIVAMFGRDIFHRLGRKKFWTLLMQVSLASSVAAVAVYWLAPTSWLGGESFSLIQGQNILLTILIAAFATVAGEATILLFFVLPIQAKWFLPLEVLFGFMGFLQSRDLAGFIGILVAVVLTNRLLDRSGGNLLRQLRLRAQHLLYRLRLAWARKRRGLRIVKDDTPKQGPWVN